MNAIIRLLAVVAVGLSLNARSQTFPDANSDVDHYHEPGTSGVREALGQHLTERVDPFTGNLQLGSTDILIPGSAGFELAVVRAYNLTHATSYNEWQYRSPFGRGWDIHFGRLRMVGSPVACGTQDLKGLVLELPDGSVQTFVKSNGTIPGTSSGSDYVSTGLWKAQCEGYTDGQGWVLMAPNGTRYEMRRKSFDYPFWHATRIADRNGNEITVGYRSLPGVLGLYPDYVRGLGSGSDLVSFTYAGTVLSAISSQGRTWTYSISPDSDGTGTRLNYATPPEGNAWHYEYFGNVAVGAFALSRMTLPQGGLITYTYATKNFGTIASPSNATVVATKSAASDQWTYSYSVSTGLNVNDKTTINQPGSLPTLKYEHYGLNTVAAGSLWKIGLLVRKEIVNGETQTFAWDSVAISNDAATRPGYQKYDTQVRRPRLTSRTTQRHATNFATTYSSFDGFGNAQAISEIGPSSRYRTLSYDNKTTPWIIGLVTADAVSGLGGITRTFDAKGNVLNETSFGLTTSFTYNGDGSVASRRNPRNNTTTFSNYHRGIARSEIRPEGVSITRVVDSWGNITSEYNGEGTWGYGYDGLNRLASINPPSGASTTITWASNARLRTATRGALVEKHEYDAFGRQTAHERGGIRTTFQLDPLGQRTFESFPNSSYGTTITRDPLGRPVSAMSPHGSRGYFYTATTVRIQNERSQSTTYRYDRYGNPDEGHLVAIEAPENAGVTMTKDALGLLKSVSQAGAVRNYYHDSHRHLSAISEPEIGTTNVISDESGNITSRTKGTRTTTFVYDDLDRLKQINYPAGTETATFAYNKLGQLTRAANGTATREYTYDGNGNLISDRLTVDGRTYSTDYQPDSLDGLASMTYPAQLPSSRTVSFSPDALGRPHSATPFVTSIAYRSSGNMQSISFGNGVVTTIGEHSTRLIPDSISGSGIQLNLNYTYDGVGNVTQIAGTNGTTVAINAGYDYADRLSAASGPWGSTSSVLYAGGSGNIEYKRFGDRIVNPSYANHQLSSITRGEGTAAETLQYDYDTYGNVTRKGADHFEFNDASRLTCAYDETQGANSCASASQKVEYGYDARGWRVWMDMGGVRTYYQHGMNGDLLFEETPSRNSWKQHVYVAGKRVATRASHAETTLTLDIVTDAAGNATSITATVSPATATGVVILTQFEGNVATAALVNGVAAFDLNQLECGPYFGTAAYEGDANHEGSIFTPEGTISGPRCASTTVLAVNPTVAEPSQPVTLSATVTSTRGVPTGTLAFKEAGTVLANATLNAQGQASAIVSNLPVGTHQIVADYSGSGIFGTSSSDAVPLVVRIPSNPPTVSISSPIDGSAAVTGQEIVIQASAQDSDGSIAQVEVLVNGSVVGSYPGPGPGFSHGWTPMAIGPATLTVRAIDNTNTDATSSPVTVSVSCPAADPPAVSVVSPASGTLQGPLSISLVATATASASRAIAKVEFFRDATKVGEDATGSVDNPPRYEMLMPNVGAGTYVLTAVATDTCNTTSAPSSPVTVTVEQPVGTINGGFESPVLTTTVVNTMEGSGWTSSGTQSLAGMVTSGYLIQTFRPPAPQGSQVAYVYAEQGVVNSIAQPTYLETGHQYTLRIWAMRNQPTAATFQVFVGETMIGEIQPEAGAWTEYSLPLSVNSDGVQQLEIRTVPNAQGQALFFDDVRIVRSDNPPWVRLHAPFNGQSYRAPANVTFIVEAGDGDGGVPKVEFYQGTTKLGERTQPPYELTWTGVGTGNYRVSAKVVDDSGAARVIEVPVTVLTDYVEVPNASFEVPSLGQGAVATLGATGWTYTGSAGTMSRLAATQAGVVPLAGDQIAYLLAPGSSLSAPLSLVAGSYTLAVAGTRNASVDGPFTAKVSGQVVATGNPASPGQWEMFGSVPFTVTGIQAVPLDLESSSSGGYHYFDDLRINSTALAASMGVGRMKLDLDGDGKEDMVAQRSDGAAAALLMNGTTATSSATLLAPATGWTLTHTGDFNGDGKSDLLFTHGDGRVAIWTMSGLAMLAGQELLPAGTDWRVRFVADLNGDAKDDVVLSHTDGSVAGWLMNGISVTASMSLLAPGTGFQLAATGDFNGDGKADFILSHADGSHAIWLMDGLTIASSGTVVPAGEGWNLGPVADYNGDGKDDIVWRLNDGLHAVWIMNGLWPSSGAGILPGHFGWKAIYGGDFNGDGKADILWRRWDGSYAIWLMDGYTYVGGDGLSSGADNWSVMQVRDFNGDGKRDLYWRHADGRTRVWLMDGLTLIPASSGQVFDGIENWVNLPASE